MIQAFNCRAALKVAFSASLLMASGKAAVAVPVNAPPPNFSSALVNANGSNLHFVRGGSGPAVILIHGFPEDWVEYRAIMTQLAQHFTVVAVDLPGIGRSAPASGGYDTANLAASIHDLVDSLALEKAYVVGHDLGGLVTYAYVRRFPNSVRGAMVLDVPIPGIGGWDKATSGIWNIGFAQAPRELAEKLVVGRQEAFLGWYYDLAKFTPELRAYYIQSYGAPQVHAAFEIYRALPKDGEWSAAQSAAISVPVVIAVGEKSTFSPLLPIFVEAYRAKGMTHVEGARIPGASHYVLADNPKAVEELIEQHAETGSK